MSRKLFQNLIYQTKDIIDDEFGIMDENGVIIACSNETRTGQEDPFADSVSESSEQILLIEDVLYQKVRLKNKLEFITFIRYIGEESKKLLALISINVVSIKAHYDEKFDRSSFLKHIIMDSSIPEDIHIRARELHIHSNASRVVFLVRTPRIKDLQVNEMLQGLFPNKAKDFILVLDDENTILIKELKSEGEVKEMERNAQVIVNTLMSEFMVKAVIGIGTAVDNLSGIRSSFKEAQVAINVGAIFENGKQVVNYNKLGLGRLIYELPVDLCSLFLNEVFKNGDFEGLGDEYIFTIQKFFENNLNVSETSRQMFVHRNTLVYRLDKINKITGLDITRFDDAIIFKFAMLIKRYLDRNEKMV